MNEIRTMYVVHYKYRENFSMHYEKPRIVKCALRCNCSYLMLDKAFFLEYKDAHKFWKIQRQAQRFAELDPKEISVDTNYIEKYKLKELTKELDKIYDNEERN